jgi:DNA-binding response OmpR family regulator
MITFLLGQSGIKVVSAHTVSDALLLAEADSFDLYLLDSSFPDGTGIELCKKIRASDETTPIVFYSGMSDESTRESGLDAGAQAYLIKPQDL